MPAYHSKFKDYDCDAPYGVAILPLKPDIDDEVDIVDEALEAFRINIYFHNFEVTSNADRTLVFLTVCIAHCLRLLKDVGPDEEKAKKVLGAFCHEPIPSITSGDFFMKYLTKKTDNTKGEDLARYFKEIRSVLVERLMHILYNPDWGTMDLKFWLAFHKKKFLKMEWK